MIPVLISIPHGGTRVPPELQDRVRIGPAEILFDGDAFTREIYDVADRVPFQLTTDVARAFVDLNRAEDDLPPRNPDGVIKSHTSHMQKIYQDGRDPGPDLVERLLESYHRPYHREIRRVLTDPSTGVILALDCHSMAAVGPDRSPDPGKPRPKICLGNLNGQACPQETIESLARCFRQVFGLDENDVILNRPFAGGHITRTHANNPLPWIQIEMSRDLFLRPPWFNRESLQIDQQRLAQINSLFRKVLLAFFRR